MTTSDFEDYSKIAAVNFSTLKYIEQSPLHYQHAVKVGRPDSTPLLKGRAGHTAVLEPDEFGRKYAVFKGKRRAGKDWDAFKAVHVEDDILKLEEYEDALKIRNAVRSHPVASEILKRGKAEQTIQWTDPRTGLKCKARLDWHSDLVLADLKGTGSVDARRFGALSARMKYHVQAAFYSDGLFHAFGIRPAVKIIAVEIAEPHDCAVFSFSEEDLFVGTEMYQGWLDKVAECRAAGEWPGRYPAEEPLSLPRYVFEDEDQEDGSAMIISTEESSDALEG